jgi:hypothetical protein
MKRITAIALLFTVGNDLLPAGTYTIKPQSTSVIVIKNHDKPIAVLSLVHQDGNKSTNGGKLTFHKYGDQYFLSEILSDGANMNVEIPTSKAEKRVRLQQATLHSSSQTFVATR